MPRAPKATDTLAAPPLPNQVCGSEIDVPGAAAKALCALPPNHEGDHDRFPTPVGGEVKPGVPKVSPLREEVAQDMADLKDKVAEATDMMSAVQQVFGDDIVKRPVILKLARIMASLPELKPEGFNDFHKYRFVKDTQVSGAIRPRMARENLMVIPEVLEESWVQTETKRGGVSWVTKLKVRFTVIDADSGDSVSGVGFGYGDDSGDKGANKALTAAMKYWLIKLFQIGGEDDLESDQKTDERSAERGTGSPVNVPTQVTVTGGTVEGVARGGQQSGISRAQLNALFKLYQDLNLTPQMLCEVVAEELDIPTPDLDTGDAPTLLNQMIKTFSADQAGKMITALTRMKDEPDEDAGGGYG